MWTGVKFGLWMVSMGRKRASLMRESKVLKVSVQSPGRTVRRRCRRRGAMQRRMRRSRSSGAKAPDFAGSFWRRRRSRINSMLGVTT
jgi:hypothetical protein